MSVCFARGCGAALIYAFATSGAYADLTAQDVWTDWRSYLTNAGYDVTGNEQASGRSLTVSGLSFTMQMPEADGAIAISMSELQFQGNSDGTVSVIFPSSFPVQIGGIGEDGEQFSAVIDYTQAGNSLVVSGSPSDMLYNYTAASTGIELASLSVDGQPMPASVARVAVTLKNVLSSTQVKVGNLRTYAQNLSAASVEYDLAFDDPESSDGAAFIGSLQNLGFQGTGAVPLVMDPEDFEGMLKNGLGFDGTFKFASGATNVSGSGDGEVFSAQSSSQGGTFRVALDSSNLLYDISQTATAISVVTQELPFPVALEAGIAAIKFSLPLAKSDAEQDFAFGLNLGDFTMSDMLWSMFDPAANLPRDPATVAMDVTGKAKVLADFMNPDVAETLAMSGQAPGELNALTINSLLVSLVGAKLTGTGDFTFDNTDLVSFDGMPRPEGVLDLELIGANGLIDRLIGMGFVSNQDAMGARMMMGMLAVPGQGEDTLNSRIEINSQGQILANGQRIK